jgi:hypothetical protein
VAKPVLLRKTSILKRKDNQFSEHDWTSYSDISFRVNIFDASGDGKCRPFALMFCQRANVAVIGCDITRGGPSRVVSLTITVAGKTCRRSVYLKLIY